MDISVALPLRRFEMEELKGFAKMAEDGPFACINVGERLCYDDHEALITLAALAAMTERVRLMTGIIQLPVHEPVVTAKQIASLEILSGGGRLVIGLGAGSRKPDFDATLNDWHTRGKRLGEGIRIMKKVWAGEPPYEGCEPVLPSLPNGRPELIIGGFAEAALKRAGELADGLHSFDFVPDIQLHLDRYKIVKDAWDGAGRSGKPRLIASTFYSLGPDARTIYEKGVTEFYGYTEEMHQWAMSPEALTSPGAIRDAVKKFEDAGVDEMLFATAHHLGPEALGWLADAIG